MPGSDPQRRRVRIIGPGRAGNSFAGALEHVGWEVTEISGRNRSHRQAAQHVELLLIATPDRSIASVASEVDPNPDTVVAHVAGAVGLAVLERHPRRAALHPLVALPSAEVGIKRLLNSAWFAVSGDRMAHEIVEEFGGTAFELADENRRAYHAAACIASNHLVALFGQVERLASHVGVPLEAFVDLAEGTLESVAMLGPRAALTGPAARGDEATIAGHLAVLDSVDRRAYQALADLARRLASAPVDSTEVDSAKG